MGKVKAAKKSGGDPISNPIPHALPRRSVILMFLAVVSGGNFFMENPMNSLIAQHPRYVWMVERLLEFGIKASDLFF